MNDAEHMTMKSFLRFRPLPPLAGRRLCGTHPPLGEGWDGGACLKAFMLVAMSTLSPWSAFAAEPETPPATEPAAPASEAEKTADDAAKPAEASEADKGGEKSTADKGTAAKGSPQRFIPSEQVRADFDVSFPIDI